MDIAVFCIGTFHSHTEEDNVLVALHWDCRYAGLGLVRRDGSHDARSGPNAPRKPPRNGGYKLIVDGQGPLGSTLGAQANKVIEVIEGVGFDRVTNVRLVGHSRGSVLAMLIANRLRARAGGLSCDLFLYDPVKKASKGAEAMTIGPNVNEARIVVAEDEGGLMGKKFKLLNVRGAPGGSNWVRLPGTHGTMTQVTGHPIGTIGYMLAAEWLRGITPAVPINPRYSLAASNFLLQYGKINEVNRVVTVPGRIYGQTRMRMVNDDGDMKRVKLGGRNRQERINRYRQNPFMGREQYFVNLDHFYRFGRAFPTLARVVAGNNAGLGLGGSDGAISGSTAYRAEYRRFASVDPGGFRQAVRCGIVEVPEAPRKPRRIHR